MVVSDTVRSGNGRTLILTAERRQGKLLVIVDGHDVWLGYSLFRAVVTLVSKYIESRGCGFVYDSSTVYPSAVCRLRKAIDSAAGSGVGRQLIETGVGAEYRLALHTAIAIDRHLQEASQFISADDCARIRAACEVVDIQR